MFLLSVLEHRGPEDKSIWQDLEPSAKLVVNCG